MNHITVKPLEKTVIRKRYDVKDGDMIIKESDQFYCCCFENIFIDISLATEGAFKSCYFENVKFSSQFLTGIDGSNYLDSITYF